MEIFKDKNGKQWTIEIDLAAADRVAKIVEIDILDTGENAPVFTFLDDYMLTANVLYAVCKPQADEANIGQEDFWRAIGDGTTITDAGQKLWSEIANFFPPGRRDSFKAHTARLSANYNRAHEMAGRLLTGDAMTNWENDIFERVESATEEVLQGKRSINSLRSLASELKAEHSDNST